MDEFLRRPHPAIVAVLRPDGAPHAAATWYDWDGERVLLSSNDGNPRLGWMHRDGRVALTVLDTDNWYTHATLHARVARIEDDADLADADRLSMRYGGAPFPDRATRRVSAWLTVESWTGWKVTGPWTA
jgi:PPOX class probable F420-dependent enzyme